MLGKAAEPDDYVWKDNTRLSHRTTICRALYWVSGIAAVFVMGIFLMRDFYQSERNRHSLPAVNSSAILESMPYVDSDKMSMCDTKELTAEPKANYAEVDSLISQGRYERALNAINEQQDKLTWLKIQALLGMNQIDSAIILLNGLRSKNGEYREAADSLYYSIK